MSSCAKCGACSVVCPVFRTSGRESHTARGKLHLLDTLGLAESSSVFVDIFSACLLCGACMAVCPRHIDISKELVSARNSFSSFAGPHAYEKYLTRKLLDYPGSLTGFRVLGHAGEKLLGERLPDGSGLRRRLALFRDDVLAVSFNKRRKQNVADGTRLTWFPGCASRYLFPDILASCRSLLANYFFSLDLPDDLVCCGLADWAAGDLEGARKNGRKNIEILEAGDGPILVSCASCFAQLKKYPELFADNKKWQIRAEQMVARVVELSDFLEDLDEGKQNKAADSTKKNRVFYHDPCHMRYGSTTVDKAREQLQRITGIEVLELPDGPRCCGQGGLFHVAHPEISARIRDELVKDVLALRPDVVTSTCSGCLMQWQQGLAAAGSEVQVLHLAQVLEQG
ncbi:MAG: (Fe-S)-binding protein [Thermodesulfobacteriota bacterium]|nr:(Fe-S)-binding protein [Thermodesulfobacteriota bacterium]